MSMLEGLNSLKLSQVGKTLAMKFLIHLVLILGSSQARIEVSRPHPLDGPPVNFLPEPYVAHFVHEGKRLISFISSC